MMPYGALPMDMVASPPLVTLDLHSLSFLVWLAAGLGVAAIVGRLRRIRRQARPLPLRSHPGNIPSHAA